MSSITGVGAAQSLALSSVAAPQKPAPVAKPQETQGPSFSERMGGAVDQLAEAQKNAADAAKDFEMGRTEDLAGVMVEQQVASLGFQLTLQVRNKALTAYRDIMNMPV